MSIEPEVTRPLAAEITPVGHLADHPIELGIRVDERPVYPSPSSRRITMLASQRPSNTSAPAAYSVRSSRRYS